MLIYVAAPWIKGGDAKELAAYLEGQGHQITSRWLDRVKGNTDPNYDYTKDPNYTEPDAQAEAFKDIEDVQRADFIVVLNSAKSEGKAVELGIALASGVPSIIMGERTNTFHYFEPPMQYLINNKEEIEGCLNHYLGIMEAQTFINETN